MSLKRTYIDSGVLISAFRGVPDISLKALQILDDPTREFASSIFVQLETLPKAVYHKQQQESEFYEAFLATVTLWATNLEEIVQIANQMSRTYGLAAMDALHIARDIGL